MANPIRRFFESIAYAGLKPSGGVSLDPKPPRRFGALRDKLDLILNGGRQTDPLYLSNRAWNQKLRAPLLIGIPALVILGALALVFTHVFAPKAVAPKPPTPAEMMANLLPNLQNTVHLDAYAGAEIVELRVLRDGPPKVSGTLHNKTGSVISVDLDIELANIKGSRVGSLTERVSNAQPNGDTHFEFPAANPDAMYAIVRTIRPVQ